MRKNDTHLIPEIIKLAQLKARSSLKHPRPSLFNIPTDWERKDKKLPPLKTRRILNGMHTQDTLGVKTSSPSSKLPLPSFLHPQQ